MEMVKARKLRRVSFHRFVSDAFRVSLAYFKPDEVKEEYFSKHKRGSNMSEFRLFVRDEMVRLAQTFNITVHIRLFRPLTVFVISNHRLHCFDLSCEGPLFQRSLCRQAEVFDVECRRSERHHARECW